MIMLRRGQPGYEEARQRGIWQRIKPERHPDAIASATTANEAAAIIREARERGLAVALKGSGHNYTSSYLRDGGLLLDLSALDHVEIDGDRARVGPGARSGDACRVLNAAGRAFPTGHHAGVTLGGFLLGGGMGWNGESWGQFACFSIDSMDVVLASGEQVTISEAVHPDLFWAARGAGPLFFAAVTSFRLRTFPKPTAVKAIRRAWPLAAAGELSDWLAAEGMQGRKDFEIILMYQSDPQTEQMQAVVLVIYHGSDDAASTAELAALLRAAPAGGAGPDAPIALDYAALYSQSLTGEARRTGADTIWTDAPAAASRIMADAFARSPSSTSVGIVNFRANPPVLPDAACSMIGCGFLQWIGQWDEQAADIANFAWVEELADKLGPLTKGCYVNETDILRRPERLQRCFSQAAWERLGAVRRKYDPHGVFPAPLPDPR